MLQCNTMLHRTNLINSRNQKEVNVNVIERNMELQRQLIELQTETWRKLFEQGSASSQRLVDLGSSFAQAPAGGDFAAWGEAQRQLAESLWSGYQDDVRERGEIVRDAFTQASTLIRDAFAPAAEEAVEEAAA